MSDIKNGPRYLWYCPAIPCAMRKRTMTAVDQHTTHHQPRCSCGTPLAQLAAQETPPSQLESFWRTFHGRPPQSSALPEHLNPAAFGL